MSNRIMAALDYLDAHSAPVVIKQKQRSLGDIEAKYNVVNTFDLPFDVLMDGSVVLTGTSRTGISRDKSLDQILDEDREKIAIRAQRSKSASFHKHPPSSRPQTSISSGSALQSREAQRRSFRSNSHVPPTSASKTSTKKLTFTPPGVHVGPSDARDEVMEEIVNKPLTHTPSKTRISPPVRSRTAVSAPVMSQNRTNVNGSRSMTSMSRSRTSHGRSRNGESEGQRTEIKPGPFKTVKVTGPDMWVISSSTPASYFCGDLTDQNLLPDPSLNAKSNWEETANSIPHQEKKSPPRHERQLGAPPQFGPIQQWYSFAGGPQNKQKPVLAAFADETDNEYYSIESRVGQKVAALLEGSPGIRIGVNGNVVSQSMKIDKQHDDVEKDLDEQWDSVGNETPDISVKDEKEEDRGSEQSEDRSQQSSRLSQHSEKSEDENSSCAKEREDKQYSLLRYLGIARGDNPYVVESSSESSSTDVMSLLNNLRKSDKPTTQNTYNEQEEALWKILEGASPTLWMSKERWKTTQAVAQMKKEMASKIEDNPGPLSWQDQLKQDDDKILKPRLKADEGDKNLNKDRVPVVFHKLVDYEKLPFNFVHLTSNGFQSHSSVAAVDKDLDLSSPSKGFANTVSALPKTSKSVLIEEDSSKKVELPQRPYTSQSHMKRGLSGNEITSGLARFGSARIASMSATPGATTRDKEEKTAETKTDDVSKEELDAIRIEAARKMKMTGGALEENVSLSRELTPNSVLGRTRNEKEHVTDAVSFRRTITEKSVTLSNLPVKSGGTLATVDIRPVKQRSTIPVGPLNISDMEDPFVSINGPTPTPAHSARAPIFSEAEGIGFPLNSSFANGGHSPPANTPKSPVSYHYIKDESVPSSPTQPDRHTMSSVGSRYLADASSSRIKRGSKSASFLSRTSSMTPRTNIVSISQGHSRHAQNRSVDELSESSPRDKTQHKHHNKFIGGALKVNKIGKPTNQASIIPHGNTYADLITKSGFIQISQPIHISPQQRGSSAGVGSGNKMYDSYMRELSTRSGRTSQDPESAADKSGAVVGKRLGGSSTKLLPEYFRQPRRSGVALARVKGGHSGFAAQSGRHSGLAITSEQSRSSYGNMTSEGTNGLGMGLQGGQLRLNLDKNIHVIYRDLGILKKSSKPSSVTLSRQHSRSSEKSEKRDSRSASQRSDSTRSRVLSAKSGRRSDSFDPAPSQDPRTTTPLSSHVNPIDPTEGSLRIDVSGGDQFSVEEKENHSVERDTNEKHERHRHGSPLQTRNSSAKSKSSVKGLNVNVTDSGTQWSPHPQESPKVPTHLIIPEPRDDSDPNATPEPRDDSDPNATPEPGHVSDPNSTPAENLVHENDGEAQKVSTPQSPPPEQINPSEFGDEMPSTQDQTGKPADDATGQRSISPSATHVRSASGSLMQTNVKEPENNIDEEIDIRGVTKVTVNIATSGQASVN